MRITGSWTRSRAAAAAILIVLAAPPYSAAQQAPAPRDLSVVLERVGERIGDYYRRVQSIVLREKATMLEVSHDFAPAGFSRVTEYELHIEPSTDGDGPGGSIVRELLKINGRTPRPTDKKDAHGCTDSNPVSPEPLAFLMPEHRGDYRFTLAGPGKGKDRNSILVDFSSAHAEGDGTLTEDPNGHPDCFSFSIPVIMKGRLWIDGDTFDVLRLEQHMAGPGDIRVPFEQQRKHNLPDRIVVERHDTTIRYNKVAFTDPEETLVLPQSIETLMMVRGGLQSIRKRQEFSDYRRFLTGGRIVK